MTTTPSTICQPRSGRRCALCQLHKRSHASLRCLRVGTMQMRQMRQRASRRQKQRRQCSRLRTVRSCRSSRTATRMAKCLQVLLLSRPRQLRVKGSQLHRLSARMHCQRLDLRCGDKAMCKDKILRLWLQRILIVQRLRDMVLGSLVASGASRLRMRRSVQRHKMRRQVQGMLHVAMMHGKELRHVRGYGQQARMACAHKSRCQPAFGCRHGPKPARLHSSTAPEVTRARLRCQMRAPASDPLSKLALWSNSALRVAAPTCCSGALPARLTGTSPALLCKAAAVRLTKHITTAINTVAATAARVVARRTTLSDTGTATSMSAQARASARTAAPSRRGTAVGTSAIVRAIATIREAGSLAALVKFTQRGLSTKAGMPRKRRSAAWSCRQLHRVALPHPTSTGMQGKLTRCPRNRLWHSKAWCLTAQRSLSMALQAQVQMASQTCQTLHRTARIPVCLQVPSSQGLTRVRERCRQCPKCGHSRMCSRDWRRI